MKTRLFKAISLIIATAVLFSAAPVTVLAEQDSLLAWESEDEPEDPMPEDDSVIEEEEPATDEPASDEPEAVILEEAAGVDTLTDENSVEGAVTEEIAEGTPTEDDELLEETENLVQYLREGADPDTLEQVPSTYKHAVLGGSIDSRIYTYNANLSTYYALYIWSDSNNGSLNNPWKVASGFAYNDYKDKITDIIMDDSVQKIETQSMFENLTKLSYVRFSSKLESFSNRLFSGCTSLESVTIPKGLREAGGETFFGCTSLKTITFEDGIKKIPDNFASNTGSCSVETVNIPSSVTDIGDKAFYSLKNLTTLNFMDSAHTTLAHIGRQAFSDTNLNGVILPKFGGKWTDPVNNKSYSPVIEGLAFADIPNTSFETLVIPEGVTSIDEIWGQYPKNKWKEIYLPSTVQRSDIGETNKSGLHQAFTHYGTMPVNLLKIYYNGTEEQFFTKALGIKDSSWREGWKTSYSPIYEKLIFKTAAPKQVSTLSADTTSILKYYDEVTEGQQLTINLAVSPQSHINTVYKAVSSDSSVVSVTLGTEADGILPVKLTFHKKVGDATVTVSGGEASATISVTIKEKEKVAQPLIRLNGGAPFDSSKTVEVFKGDQITIECPTYDSKIEYQVDSGSWMDYSGKIMVGADVLKNAADEDSVTIKAHATKTGLTPSDESQVITLKYKLDWGDVQTYDLDGSTPIPGGMWISEASYDDDYPYTGSAITCPELRVFYYNKLLTNGKDYTVKYKDNVNSMAVSGTKASFTVTGKGDYVGCAATGTFTIAQRDIGLEASKLDFTPVVLKYNGKDQKPKLNITFDGRKLTAGKDYRITFPSSETVNGKGTYTGYITGLGNYKNGTYLNDVVYVIDPGESVNMSAVKVTGVKNQQLITPGTIVEVPFTVTYNKQTIASDDSAYTVTYKNNTHAGTASIIFEGTNAPVMIGGKNIRFVGKKILTFKIAPIKLIEPKIDVDPWTYNGKAAEPYTEVRMGSKLLVEGEDYTLSYKNNKNAGTGTVTVTGKGDYTGKITKKFTIEKLDLSGCTVRLLGGDEYDEYEYCQVGVSPKIDLIPYSSWNWKLFPDYLTLPQKDYKITYSNYKTPGTATITIEGKGNLTGNRTVNYTIKSGKLYNCTTVFTDKIYSRKPNIHKQKLTIKDPYGKTLKAGRDYDKDFRYFYIEDTTVEQKIGKSYFNVSRPANSLVRDEDIIPAGTSIRVVINGMGNYNDSSLYGSFRIGAKKVSSLKLTIPTMKITGVRVLPSKDDITVKNGSWDDFDIISYGPNNKKGTGTVTVRGRGNYIGIATIKFKIVN